jgi:L-ascorbate metabolism protein UlaG (beta-lactamase superfamily)
MNSPSYYLRPDVVVEPLIARWHAWSGLISPVTAALNVVHRHLDIMTSYVSMPQVHAAAARDPALLGGPFIDLEGGRVGEVRALLDWTRQQQQPAIQLAEDLATVWTMLQHEADGHGMTNLYKQLPDSIRGAVELVYTPSGAPDIRLIEPLLYQSPCYNPKLQGAMIRRIRSDHRAFAFSTPRLDLPDAIYLDGAFKDPVYDKLASLRFTPQPLSTIADIFQIGSEKRPLLESFLTSEAPARAPKSSELRWRYFGHACVLVETFGGQSVLVDPVIAYESGTEPERFTAADLPSHIDFVVITHNHPDHVLIETLLSLRHKISTVLVPMAGGSLVDPSLKLVLEAIGFETVRELSCMEEVIAGDLRIRALPFLGEHADLDIRCKAAWLVEAESMRLLFAADSNNLDPVLYDRLAPLIGHVDTLFIGMECRGAPMSWMYGTLLPEAVERSKDQSRRLDGSDCERAKAIISSLDIEQVCVYAMGMEPWLKFISSLDPTADSPALQESQALVDHCNHLGLPAERLYGRSESLFLTEYYL